MTPLRTIDKTRVRPYVRRTNPLGSAHELQPPTPPRSATCVAPGCRRSAQHRHHIVARSILSGPHDFILIDFEKVVLNLADLCVEHHDALENHGARLRWLDGVQWGWYKRADEIIPDDKAGIWWIDRDSPVASVWQFLGFLDGDFVFHVD